MLASFMGRGVVGGASLALSHLLRGVASSGLPQVRERDNAAEKPWQPEMCIEAKRILTRIKKNMSICGEQKTRPWPDSNRRSPVY